MKGVNHMEEMISVLKRIGLPESECARIQDEYRNDLEGLSELVLYMRAILDDRHEYV